MTPIHNLFALALLALFLGCQGLETSQREYVLPHRITDHADILTTEQEDSLVTLMQDLERKVGSQVAILTVPALNGEKIEALSFKTAEATGLGRATHDDGVLITIAYEDRQTRIEVGTGLEDILKDDIAARIIRDDMAPQFRKGKFGAGLYIAIGKIATLIGDNQHEVGKGLRSK